jgi:hypothetical protein
MTPLTKEQAEALARVFDERVRRAEINGEFAEDDRNPEAALCYRAIAVELDDISHEIRNGTFIEVQP